MPKVSVIVPNYNHAPFLTQRIESVLKQRFQDYELILLDDASTDGSRRIIHDYGKRYGGIRAYCNRTNRGSPSRQWDLGVSKALGTYVWIAESDDYAHPDFLGETVSLLDRNHRVGLAYCDAVTVDAGGVPIALCSDVLSRHYGDRWKRGFIHHGRTEAEHVLAAYNTINNASGVLFRKKAYCGAGLAEHGLVYCGDWFLYLRMLLNWDIAFTAKALNFIRIHSRSSSGKYYGDDRYLAELIRVHGYIRKTFTLPSRTVGRARDHLAWEFSKAIRAGHLPSRKLFRDMRKIFPYFEMHLAKYVIQRLMGTCRRE